MTFDKYPQIIFTSSKISDENMSIKYGNVKKVLENRRKFFKKLDINPKNVIEVKQTQGNKVILINIIPNPDIEADGLITNKDGLYLMVKTADCLAIGLYDPNHHAIGLVHAGFRGLENDVIKKVIKALRYNFKTSPNDLIVKISPSIGPCHYKMNIWERAENQLIKMGVLKENIENYKICTYESSDYFSHRRSDDTNTKEGRFVTILGLKNAN